MAGFSDPRLSLEQRQLLQAAMAQFREEHSVNQPDQQGLLGWTYDPAPIAGATAPSLGVEVMMRVTPIRSGRCGGGVISLSAGGTTLVSNQCFLGLRDAAGNLIAKSASQHTAWGTSGHKLALWTTGVDLVEGVHYWLCLVHNGAAAMTVLRAGTADVVNYNCPTGKARHQSLGAGVTDLTASVTMTNADAANQHALWGAII